MAARFFGSPTNPFHPLRSVPLNKATKPSGGIFSFSSANNWLIVPPNARTRTSRGSKYRICISLGFLHVFLMNWFDNNFRDMSTWRQASDCQNELPDIFGLQDRRLMLIADRRWAMFQDRCVHFARKDIC